MAQTRFWVIGGRYADAALSQRAWSEVLGPYDNLEAAQAAWGEMSAIYAGHPLVRFSLVQDAHERAA